MAALYSSHIPLTKVRSCQEEARMDEQEVIKKVDARGEKCPTPILWAKRALAKMESGQVLEVLATDPSAVGDFRFFCEQTGNRFLDEKESDGEFTITLKRK